MLVVVVKLESRTVDCSKVSPVVDSLCIPAGTIQASVPLPTPTDERLASLLKPRACTIAAPESMLLLEIDATPIVVVQAFVSESTNISAVDSFSGVCPIVASSVTSPILDASLDSSLPSSSICSTEADEIFTYSSVPVDTLLSLRGTLMTV